MAHIFPSDGWVDSLADILNHDERYAHVARGWEGDLLFEIRPDEGTKDGEDGVTRVYLDLWHGQCRKAAFYPASAKDFPRPTFIMGALRADFVRILTGALDPMQAMLTRRLQVIGNMGYVLRNVPVVLDFVRCCRKVEIDLRTDA
ncbi:MAG TPA: SCP2 sterol-binding domain-containing protein [Anaerolineales bacterium]|nr:SCP2 sterol-binding domain-containing protein [Anaerolineales bacterium]